MAGRGAVTEVYPDVGIAPLIIGLATSKLAAQ